MYLAQKRRQLIYLLDLVADDPGVEAGLSVGSAPGVPGGAAVEGPGAIPAPRCADSWPLPDRLGGSADGSGLTGSGIPGGHGLPGGTAPGSFGLLGVADPEGPTPGLPGAHGGGGTGVRGTGGRGRGAFRSFFAGGGPIIPGTVPWPSQ